MAQPKRPCQRDRFTGSSVADHVADSSSKDKKILPGRRQQRHSTEIGCEYHRWWAVRSAVGFETNEHIAGLLLDGFQSALQLLVVMCGGEMFDPKVHGLETLDDASNDTNSAAYSGGVGSCSSSSFSSSTSPPGLIEDMEEFVLYKSTIGHCCDSLWTACRQHDRMQGILANLRPPIRQFLIKLIGYIRSAKGKSLHTITQKRKRSRSSSARTDEPEQPQHGMERNVSDPRGARLQVQEGGFGLFQDRAVSDYPSGGKKNQGEFSRDNIDRTLGQASQGHSQWHLTHASHGTDKVTQGLFNIPDLEPAPKRDVGDKDIYQKDSAGSYDSRSSDRNEKGYKPTELEADVARHQYQNDGSDPALNYQWTDGENMHLLLHKEMLQSKAFDDESKVNEHFQHDWIRLSTTGNSQQMGWAGSNKTTTKIEGTPTVSWSPSLPPSVPGTPRVYLDRDSEPAMDTSNCAEQPTPQQGDLCLKSLLSRSVKIQPVSIPRFVNDDGSKWPPTYQSLQGGAKQGLKQESDLQNDKKLTSSEREHLHKLRTSDECDNTTATDLSINSRIPESTIISTGSKPHDTGKLRAMGSVPLSYRSSQQSESTYSTLTPLVQPGTDSLRPHPLGTPVLLYPAGGFPCTDNSLASLPTLVQNIVYNSSGSSLLQPLSDQPGPICPGSLVSHNSSNSQSTALTNLNKEIPSLTAGKGLPLLPGGSSVQSTNPTLMPLYMANHSALDTLYNLSKTANSSANSQQPVSLTALTTMSTSLAGSSHLASNNIFSSTRLYHESSIGGPVTRLSSFPKDSYTQSYNSNPSQFKITNVRSCNDADFPSPSPKKTQVHNCGEGSSYLITTSQHKMSTPSDQTGSTYTECQGLSGRKLSVFSGTAENQGPRKSSNEGNRNATSSKTVNNSKNTSISAVSDTSQPRLAPRSASSKRRRSSPATSRNKQASCHQSQHDTVHQKATAVDKQIRPITVNNHPKTVISRSLRQELSAGNQEGDNRLSTRDPKQCLTTTSAVTKAIPSSSNRLSRRHACSICQLVFSTGTDLFLHRYEHHSLVCGECGNHFLSSSGLQRHKETDHPPLVRCSECRFVTYKQEELASHKVSVHGMKTDGKKDSVDHQHQQAHIAETERQMSTPIDCTTEANYSHLDNSEMELEASSSKGVLPACGNIPVFPELSLGLGPSLARANGAGQEESGKHQEVDNAGSESEEPRLVIDTSGCGYGLDKRERPATPPPTQLPELNIESKEDQPLCLVVHTRDTEIADCGSLLGKKLEHEHKGHARDANTDVNAENIPEGIVSQFESSAEPRSNMDSSQLLPALSTDGKSDGPAVKISEKDTAEHLENIRFGRKCKRASRKLTIADDDVSKCTDDPYLTLSAYSNCLNKDSSLTTVDEDTHKGSNELTNWDDMDNIEHSSELDNNDINSALTHKGVIGYQNKSLGNPHVEDNSLLAQNGVTGVNETQTLTLRDRHTMSSLPPKKRSFRKSPRHSNGNGNVANVSVHNRSIKSGQPRTKSAANKKNFSRNCSESNLQTEIETKHGNTEEKNDKPTTTDEEKRSSSRQRKMAIPHYSGKQMRSTFTGKAVGQPNHMLHHTRVAHKASNAATVNKMKPKLEGGIGSDFSTAKSKSSSLSGGGGLPTAKERRFRCPEVGCGATFTRKWTMDSHLTRVHVKVGLPLACHMAPCQLKFSSRRELRQHVTETHKGKVRRYTCSWPECGKGFFARTHLRTHLLVHTGEKPVACQMCDYRCRQRTALIWHMRKHGISHQQASTITKEGSSATDL